MKKEISASKYIKAEEWCKGVVKTGHDLLFSTDKFDTEITKASIALGYSMESLNSFLRNTHLQYVKKRSHAIRNQMHSHILVDYAAGNSIISIAKKYNYSPSLLARAILGKISTFEKKRLTNAMKDPLGMIKSIEVILEDYRGTEEKCEENPSIIDPFSGRPVVGSLKSTRLAREVLRAINSDPLYGPRFDKERNYIGIEYEVLLERSLSSMNIPFETEEQLRARGTPRTPDILFSCPVAIKVPKRFMKNAQGSVGENMVFAIEDKDYMWKMVCWIDSKALFGDVVTHQSSVLPQAQTYVHRFGPGLILYWFGHAPIEMLGTGHGDDVFVIGWDIPKVFMMPTSDIARDGHSVASQY